MKRIWHLERRFGKCKSLFSCLVLAEREEEAIEIAKSRVSEEEQKFWNKTDLIIRDVLYSGEGDFLVGFPYRAESIAIDLLEKLTGAEMLVEKKEEPAKESGLENNELNDLVLNFNLEVKIEWPQEGSHQGAVLVSHAKRELTPMYYFTKIVPEDEPNSPVMFWRMKNENNVDHYYSTQEKLVEAIVRLIRSDWRLTR